MSTESTKIRRGINPPQEVILKGFSDEPLKLLAIFDRGNAIEVAPTQSDEPMPFPADCVFRYDAGLFEELSRAAAIHDGHQLHRAWARATPFKR